MLILLGLELAQSGGLGVLHLTVVFEKLRVTSRTQAVPKALELKLISS